MGQVKTAISIEQGVFATMNAFAKKAHVSRSRLFEIAVRDWIRKERSKDVTARINRAVEKYRPTAEDLQRKELEKTYQQKMVQRQEPW